MAKRKSKRSRSPRKWHAVPLKSSFMASAMLGFFISAYYVYPKTFQFGVTFMFIFALMFVAALISMTKAPAINEKY